MRCCKNADVLCTVKVTNGVAWLGLHRINELLRTVLLLEIREEPDTELRYAGTTHYSQEPERNSRYNAQTHPHAWAAAALKVEALQFLLSLLYLLVSSPSLVGTQR